MGKKYKASIWSLEWLLDSTQYAQLAKCVDLVEHGVEGFDDRNETRLLDDYGGLIQMSFLLTCVAQMEHHLKKICEAVAETRNLAIQAADMRGANGFESCVAYLEKVLQVPMTKTTIAPVRAIVKLRNAWVHNGGYLDDVPSGLGDLDKHVKRAEDGRMGVSAPFVQECCITCRDFVETVVKAIEAAASAWVYRKVKTTQRRSP